MWPEKVVLCKFCGTTHQLRINCDEKKAVNNNSPPNEEGSVMTTRKDEINRVVGESKEPNGHMPGSMDPPTQTLTHPSTDTQDDILKSKAITRTMGPDYTEVIGGESQIKPSSNDSANSSTHNKGTKIDQAAPQTMKPDQEMDLRQRSQIPGKNLKMRCPLQLNLFPVSLWKRSPMLRAPTATMQPRLSLLSML